MKKVRRRDGLYFNLPDRNRSQMRFAAIIALLVTNIQVFSADKSVCQVLTINVAVIASVAVLMLFVWLIQKWRR